jgi:DNA-binding transcriptional regulator GbsR (MarR family)
MHPALLEDGLDLGIVARQLLPAGQNRPRNLEAVDDVIACRIQRHLSRELKVSPASISKAINYLEGLELVRREPDPGKRHEHYLIAEDIWVQAWRTSARANANWAGTARKGADLFDPATPAGERLERMSQFFQQLSDDMSGLGPDPEVAEDTATILAALVHAHRPLTADQLAAALGWPIDRVTTALTTAEAYKPFTDPLALDIVAPDTYTVVVTRLTDAQRHALTIAGSSPQVPDNPAEGSGS